MRKRLLYTSILLLPMSFSFVSSFSGTSIVSVKTKVEERALIEDAFLGPYRSSVLTSNGTLYTMGQNGHGELGDGTVEDKNTPVKINSQFNLEAGETIVHSDFGYWHSAALSSTGKLYTWGFNNDGELGNGTTTSSNNPVDITSQFSLGEGETIVDIALGSYHAVALTSASKVFTWGNNLDDQLGIPDFGMNQVLVPTNISGNFTLVGDEKIIDVSAGSAYSGALTSTGRVFLWGDNLSGQQGDGTSNYTNRVPTEITANFNLTGGEKITALELGGDHSAAITSNGQLYMWGRNDFGQLGNGNNVNQRLPVNITNRFSLTAGDKIAQVDINSWTSIALSKNGQLFTWGFNQEYVLGDGTANDRNLPLNITAKIPFTFGETLTDVYMGGGHAAALTSFGRLYFWGSNWFGQHGNENMFGGQTPQPILLFTYRCVISFEEDGGSEVTDIIDSVDMAITAPAAPTKLGYTFAGWYIDSELTTAYTFATMPDEDLTLYAKWSATDYTISFEVDGGTAVSPITQGYGTTVATPTAPTKTGYTFAGWYSDSELTTAYMFATMPLNGITLYAKWSANEYTISFEVDGGTAVSPITQAYGAGLAAPTPPTKAGYTFAGWYINSELTTAYTWGLMPLNGLTLYAKWTINQYTISFEVDSGTAVSAITQDYGSPVTAPEEPTREGYTFAGWYSDSELTTAYMFATMPDDDLTLYAKWVEIEATSASWAWWLTLLLVIPAGYFGYIKRAVIVSTFKNVLKVIKK